MATPADAQAAVDAASAPGSPPISKAIWTSVMTIVIAVFALYAPLDSPGLTGAPTAPTVGAGDSSTRLATTAFVATSFATINYVPPVSNPQTRTKGQKLADFTSVCDFAPGCDPTGAASSVGAFNAAYAWAYSRGGAGLWVPTGQFRIDGAGVQSLIGENITLQGNGTGSTIIVNYNTSKPALTLGTYSGTSGGGPWYYRNQVKDMTFVGGPGVTGIDGQTGVSMFNQQDSLLQNVDIRGDRTGFTALYRGLVQQNAVFGQILNVNVTNCLLDGVTLLAHSDTYAFHLRSDNNLRDGYLFAGVQALYSLFLTAHTNGGTLIGRYGINWAHDSTPRPNINNIMVGTVLDSQLNSNMVATDLVDSRFPSSWFSSQNSVAVNTTANGVLLQGVGVSNVSFTDSIIAANNGSGLVVRTDGTGSPTNIKVVNSSLGMTSTGESYGNGRAGPGFGLQIDATSGTSTSDVTVIGGQMLGNTSGAISSTTTGCLEVHTVRGTTGDLTCNAPVESNVLGLKTADYVVVDGDSSITYNCAGTCNLALPIPGNYCGRVLKIKTIANQTVTTTPNYSTLAGASSATLLTGGAGKYKYLKANCSVVSPFWDAEAGN